jgi:predicted transposase/invertase (TIGR01784 family)
MFDKWMFVLHNLYRLLERPKALQDRVFQKLFDQAEIARYSETERRQYEDSKKVFWDNYSVLKTAEKKGILKTARNMKAKGFSVNDIAEITGLTIEEIETL